LHKKINVDSSWARNYGIYFKFEGQFSVYFTFFEKLTLKHIFYGDFGNTLN